MAVVRRQLFWVALFQVAAVRIPLLFDEGITYGSEKIGWHFEKVDFRETSVD